MIPILYQANEIEFLTDGICRLSDCISCKVTEERNGIYECDFEYPVQGLYFDEIQLGRIISVTHDDTGDRQAFDIVSYSKPINGIVSFHAVHISYRQSKIVAVGENINTLSDAFTMLQAAAPANPFIYTADFDSTAYMSAADGIPKSVRSLLGGVEGSILDTYGGEFEWNMWAVRLHKSRGKAQNKTVRYGVNLTGYKDDSDASESYSAVIPYWTGMDENNEPVTVTGSMITSGASYNGRTECVPLDLTSRFESEPTTADLEAMARTVVLRNDGAAPRQTIEIESLADLEGCRLCDTINVEYPAYSMSGTLKIVKTVYNVLLDRFDSMELGTLSVSLSEALGSGGSTSTPAPGSGGDSSPVGTVTMFAGSSAPTGWLLCNGAAVSRTTYATLFDAIGTTYGSGDGSTTFNLPNLQGRVPLGASSSYALGSTGGATTAATSDHTLTADEIPAHTHGSKSLSGSFNVRNSGAAANANMVDTPAGIVSIAANSSTYTKGWAESTANANTPRKVTVNASHEHESVGGGASHNHGSVSTMQPYISMNYIIKAA